MAKVLQYLISLVSECMISLQHNMAYLTKNFDEQKPSCDIFPFDQVVVLN
jgi:hypothetical protein